MKKLLLLPILTLMLAGCGGGEASHSTGLSTGGEGGSSEPAPTSEAEKEWKVVESAPAAGANYRLAMVHTNIEGSPTLWLMDKTQKENEPDYEKAKDFYIATDRDVEKAAAVELKASGDGFKVKLGARYIWLGMDGTYIDAFLKDTEDEGSVWVWNDTYKTIGATLEVEEGTNQFCCLGTRNDKTFETAGGQNIEKFSSNIKVQLYELK